jgi:anti-sigma B factor antagonist
MEISTEERGGVSLLTISGRIDSNTTPGLDEALRALINANRTRIIVDMKGVKYLGSSALRALVSAIRAAKKGGGDVRVAQPSERVKEVIELAGLGSIIVLYDDLTEAVDSF